MTTGGHDQRMRGSSASGTTVAAIAAPVVLSLAGVGLSLWANVVDGSSMVSPALSAAVVVAFVVVGAVVASARPANRVGWVMLAGGTCWALGNAGTDLAYRGIIAAAGSVPAPSACALVGGAFRSTGWYLLSALLPALFPDGRFASRRWRWLGYAAMMAIVTSILGSLLDKQANITDLGSWRNPIAVSALQPVAGLLSMLSLLAGAAASLGAIAELRYRWRRGNPLLRQQLLLFTAMLPLPLSAIVVNVVLGQGLGWLFSLTMLPVPVSIGIAVLARGLYDLRTAANRTLVWITLSAAAVGVYLLVVFGVGSLVNQAGATWLPWIASAVVAISFAPLRGVVQQTINRITFGRWQEPHTVLAELGQRLQATADVDRLLDEVVRELHDGLGLDGVSVTDADGHTLAGEPTADTVRHPLSAFGTTVGSLSYQPPASPLRRRDDQLLSDLAAHLGSLLQARRLNTDLQRARERLVLAREEERRRLRRDLHDGLGPALAGHALRLELIGREVEPGSRTSRDIAELQADLTATVRDFRKVVEGLRPPALDELGLPSALWQVITKIATPASIPLDLRAANLPPLPAAAEVAVYRIVAEAVNNAVRHSDATHLEVEITCTERTLWARISDDGRGVKQQGVHENRLAGNGVETMRERAEELGGRLDIISTTGTCVMAQIPLLTERGATPLDEDAYRGTAKPVTAVTATAAVADP
jgi:signal transduction histidine kinase